jgi:hypothetical protein
MNINLSEFDIEFIEDKLRLKILQGESQLISESHKLWNVEKNDIVENNNRCQKIIDKIYNRQIDIKYLGIPNICFSLTKIDDSREEKYSQQRMSRGFDDSETWSLRDAIANFILPRLKEFRGEGKGCYPSMFKSREKWDKKLDKMITAFEYVSRDNGSFDLSEEEFKGYEKGMKLFNKYFLNLWC